MDFWQSFKKKRETERGDHLNFLYIFIYEAKEDKAIKRY